MNEQEVIEKIKNLNARETFISETIWVKRDEVLDIVKQLDEPEKPVVPQFVADWLVVCKENLAVCLAIAMRFSFLAANDQPEETIQWLKSAKNQETFAKAWLYGYEVEKEKLYTVEIPNPHGLGHSILVKDMYENIFITYVMNSDWRKSKVNQLTEAEIKKDFDWAWQFAKDVKE